MIFGKSAVAVVSGGASGLGAATARKFASMGLRIGIFDVNVAGGEALARGTRRSFPVCRCGRSS